MLVKGEISAGHARTLLGLCDSEMILPAATKIAKRNLSVREAENLVRALNKQSAAGEKEDAPARLTVNYKADLERRAMELSGRRIKSVDSRGKRSVQIEYTSDEDLESLLKLVCGKSIIE